MRAGSEKWAQRGGVCGGESAFGLGENFDDIFLSPVIRMEEEQRSANEANQSRASSRQESYRVHDRRKERKTAHHKKPCRSETTNYYWSDRENRSYLRFLVEKGALLCQSAVERKKQKTNLKLSKYIKTRTPTQCHTHHQKMMVKYGAIEAIITEMTRRFDQQEERGRGRGGLVEDPASGVLAQMRCAAESAIKNTTREEQCQILKEQNDLQYIYY